MFIERLSLTLANVDKILVDYFQAYSIEMSLFVWSPELNSSGNSLAEIAALELLMDKLDRSGF